MTRREVTKNVVFAKLLLPKTSIWQHGKLPDSDSPWVCKKCWAST